MDIKISTDQKIAITVESLKEDYENEYEQKINYDPLFHDKKFLKSIKRILQHYMSQEEYDAYIKKVKNEHRS